MGVAVVIDPDRGVAVTRAIVVGLAVTAIVVVGATVAVAEGQLQSVWSVHCGLRQNPLKQISLLGH